MGISVFPAGGGEFITNDFVADMNDTENNVIDLGRSYASGSYNVSLASGDTSFDIYALDADGASVGYTNNATLVATDAFTSLVILGVATDEKITFAFAGASNNATSEGNAVGAGAYLESINPSDLPTIDDTANIIGGNFASDVEIYFESGTVSIEAKQVARADSTALIITRPDNLDAALDPWDVKAINPGIAPPTGSNAHILAGTVDAGAVPVWTSTSPLPNALLNTAYAATVVATDPDGGAINYTVTAGSLPTGLSLNASTGVISGTPTTGSETLTITATDIGGNGNGREFDLPVQLATGGSVTSFDGKTYHIFETSDDFVALGSIPSLEYLVVAGGGAGGQTFSNFNAPAGGGGAGGLRNSFSGEQSGEDSATETPLSVAAGTIAVTVGTGGNADRSGSTNPSNSTGGNSSSIGNLVSTTGGGSGGSNTNSQTQGQGGGSGGSGGGAINSQSNNTFFGGGRVAGEGNTGGNANTGTGGSGGGAIGNSISSGGGGQAGGAGLTTTDATSVTNFSEFAAGGDLSNYGQFGVSGTDGTGSGGAGAGVNDGGNSSGTGGGNGGDGIVIVRY